MMTPTAYLQFGYELLLENGDKKYVLAQACYGSFNAKMFLEDHGITISDSTILKALKPKTYALSKLIHYPSLTAKQLIVDHFNVRLGLLLNKAVDIHIVFQRLG